MYIVNMIDSEDRELFYSEVFYTKYLAENYARDCMEYSYGLEALITELDVSKEDSYHDHILEESVKTEVFK